jgi:hypothetical protein
VFDMNTNGNLLKLVSGEKNWYSCWDLTIKIFKIIYKDERRNWIYFRYN